MVRGKEAQISTLIYVAVAIVMLIVGIPNESVGIEKGCDWYCHFTYQFFHASALHLLVNCWALLCLVFYYEVNMKMLAVSYLISASVPVSLFPISEGIVTVGVSGVVFVLMGLISFRVRRKIYYQAWILGFIILSFFFSSCNSWLHLYCYSLGVALSALKNKFS